MVPGSRGVDESASSVLLLQVLCRYSIRTYIHTSTSVGRPTHRSVPATPGLVHTTDTSRYYGLSMARSIM